MHDSAETEGTSTFVVLGKLGDHVKKLIELEFLKDKEPQFTKGLALQIDAIEQVIANWPLTETKRYGLKLTIVALAETMRGMATAENTLYRMCKQDIVTRDMLIQAISEYKYLKENATGLLAHLNSIGDE